MITGCLVRDRASWRAGRIVGVDFEARTRWVRFLTKEQTVMQEVKDREAMQDRARSRAGESQPRSRGQSGTCGI